MKQQQIFIGMPVFNGASQIQHAINCFKKQTFQNWRLLISDNCSTDNTQEICQMFADSDDRIKYIRQSTNIGAANNFKYVLNCADTQFFMWAAYDDHWEPTFLEECLHMLISKPEIKLAFCNVFSFNWSGTQKILEYDLGKIISPNRQVTVFNYLLAFGGSGKANIIYGIYETESFRKIYNQNPMRNIYGADTVLMTLILAHFPAVIIPKFLFGKRLLPDDNLSIREKLKIGKMFSRLHLLKQQIVNLLEHVKVLKSTKFYIASIYLTSIRLLALPFSTLLEGFKIFPSKNRHYSNVKSSYSAICITNQTEAKL